MNQILSTIVWHWRIALFVSVLVMLAVLSCLYEYVRKSQYTYSRKRTVCVLVLACLATVTFAMASVDTYQLYHRTVDTEIPSQIKSDETQMYVNGSKIQALQRSHNGTIVQRQGQIKRLRDRIIVEQGTAQNAQQYVKHDHQEPKWYNYL